MYGTLSCACSRKIFPIYVRMGKRRPDPFLPIFARELFCLLSRLTFDTQHFPDRRSFHPPTCCTFSSHGRSWGRMFFPWLTAPSTSQATNSLRGRMIAHARCTTAEGCARTGEGLLFLRFNQIPVEQKTFSVTFVLYRMTSTWLVHIPVRRK